MPALKNPRHERFAQALANGSTAADAYVQAGYKADRGNATRLQQDDSVSQRLTELLERREKIDQKALETAIERTAITKERVLEELGRIGFANMMDYISINGQGVPTIDLASLDRESAAAISELVVEEFKEHGGKDAREVRRIRFKLHDKKGALVDIGRHLGMFKDRVEHTGLDGGPIEVAQITPARRRAAAALLFARKDKA